MTVIWDMEPIHATAWMSKLNLVSVSLAVKKIVKKRSDIV